VAFVVINLWLLLTQWFNVMSKAVDYLAAGF